MGGGGGGGGGGYKIQMKELIKFSHYAHTPIRAELPVEKHPLAGC